MYSLPLQFSDMEDAVMHLAAWQL